MDSQVLANFIGECGLVSKRDLERALADTSGDSGKTLEEVLLEDGKITEGDLIFIKSHILGIPRVNLFDEGVDAVALVEIPEPIARHHNIVAFRRDGNKLRVAMLEPDKMSALEYIGRRAGLRLSPYITNRESMQMALLEYKKILKKELGDAISREVRLLSGGDSDKHSPVARIVNSIVEHAVSQGVSSIHFQRSGDAFRVCYRLAGGLYDAMVLPAGVFSDVLSLMRERAMLGGGDKGLPQSGQFSVGRTLCSVDIFPTCSGERVVLRLSGDGQTSLEAIGFHGEGLDILYQTMLRASGLVLFARSGSNRDKTSLYALLDILKHSDTNIITIENEVKRRLRGVSQTQIKPELGLTYASSLRSVARQDPDVIMVEDVADEETASLVIRSALSGRLVLAAVDAPDVAGAISRLGELVGNNRHVASALKVVVAERVIRRLCESGEKYFLSRAESKALEKVVNVERVLGMLREEGVVADGTTVDKVPFFKPRLATVCPTGYGGHVAAHEVLPASLAIKETILNGSSVEALNEEARAEGVLTVAEDALFQAALGMTTIDEVLRIVNE